MHKVIVNEFLMKSRRLEKESQMGVVFILIVVQIC